MKLFSKGAVALAMGLIGVTGLVSCGATKATKAWLDEDPGAGAAVGEGRSAREIVAMLGTPEAENYRPETPEPEPAPEPQVAAEPEMAAAGESKPPPSSGGDVDVSQLDLSGDFPTAHKVEGKEGYVLSPYDGRRINVKGIRSGSLVADPRYPLEERKYFKIP